MLVYKFGGGVLNSTEGIVRMGGIIKDWNSENESGNLVVVVSALGKMTNAFEDLWQAWIEKRDIRPAYDHILNFHSLIADDLLIDKFLPSEYFDRTFNEIMEMVSGTPPSDESMAYDQLVRYGEFLSSNIVSAYLSRMRIDHSMIDAGNLISTDSTFTDAKVDWPFTISKIRETIPGSDAGRIWLTQGFIGRDQNSTGTTLGREGSDFSAAILAYALDASELIIWKDVPGIMTADPAKFSSAEKMDAISYLEAIELSYFGAKVLHPNTIKPIHNKNIILRVKSIFKPEDAGTLVVGEPEIEVEKPVVIIKANQVLLSIQPRDLSFIMEDALSKVFALLSKNKIRVNLMQHGAVSMSFCIDNQEARLNNLIGDLIVEYKVLYNSGLELLTIRHYSPKVINNLTKGRKIYVQQQSRKTARFVLS